MHGASRSLVKGTRAELVINLKEPLRRGGDGWGSRAAAVAAPARRGENFNQRPSLPRVVGEGCEFAGSHMILLRASMAGRAPLSEIFLRANCSSTPRISDGVSSRSFISLILVNKAFNKITT